MVDTNSDPRPIDYVIPSNDDAGKSIEAILTSVTEAVAEGLAERKADKEAPKEKTAAQAAPTAEKTKKVAKEKTEPVVEKKTEVKPKKIATKKAKADDLTKVEGIGPKAAEALVAAGVVTFADLAKAEADKIKTILTDASPRLAHLEPASWPKQAQMAADGKWDELKEWQDNTKGGIEDSEE